MYIGPKKKGPRVSAPPVEGKMRLRAGDTVRVRVGKDRGKEGKITKVLPTLGKVVVEGLNIQVKHQKPKSQGSQTANAQESGRITISAPIHASKVALVVDHGKGTTVSRIGITVNSDGQRVRIARKTGNVIANG